MRRGEVWWAALPEAVGAGPGYRRPVVIVQADAFTASRIATVIVAAIISRSRLGAAPGNVRLPRGASGLPRDPVINVTQVLTVDKDLLVERIGNLDPRRLRELDPVCAWCWRREGSRTSLPFQPASTKSCMTALGRCQLPVSVCGGSDWKKLIIASPVPAGQWCG